MRRPLVVLLAAVMIPATLEAQEPTLRPPPKAFQRSVSVAFSLGFHGNRAETRDTIRSPDGGLICEPCVFDYGLGNGPHLSLRFEEPVTRRTAIRIGGDLTFAPRRRDRDGSRDVTVPNDVTVLRAEGAILFRLKPNAPVFFGLGGVYTSIDPGPVGDGTVAQPKVNEVGGLITIGYDAPISERLGARFEFLNYLTIPSGDGLDSRFDTRAVARDWTLGISILYRLGQ